MAALYNEFDPKAAAWLRELIKRGLIADGEVDERSILDVQPDDLRGFTQVHFFAGIGGWSCALRLAGWPDDKPVWTGSPPCQPFSAAGQQKGKDDERHLAPHFAALVAAVRPPILFGEQVASAAVFGKAPKRAGAASDADPEWAWIDDLCGRLEAARYACGAVDLPAAGIGAPHIRQRTFFGAVRLADASGQRPDGVAVCVQSGSARQASAEAAGCGAAGGLADAECLGRQWRQGAKGRREHDGQDAGWQQGHDGLVGIGEAGAFRLGHASGAAGQWDAGGVPAPEAGEHGARVAVDGRVPVGPEHAGAGVGGLADAQSERQRPDQHRADRSGGFIVAGAEQGRDGGEAVRRASSTDGFWRDADWLFCRDGKWRPVEPGTFPLAHGLPARVVRLRGYGNAIVPQAAATFIGCFTESLTDFFCD